MYEIDHDWAGFQWVNCDDCDRSIYSFIRKSKDGKKKLLFVMNMTPIARPGFELGVPGRKKCKLILNSDDVRFGGNGSVIPKEIAPVKEECDYLPYKLTFDLPAFGSVVFEI